jgi:hypothetical protein|tara:strand:+ start:534 stop:746 length:213 start_codon:yes stop_codon:yes gene_type:complete
MSLVDYKGRNLTVGERVCVQIDIPSPEGVLYKDSIVKIDEFNDMTQKIRVTDSTGKVWWIEPSAVSCSFL